MGTVKVVEDPEQLLLGFRVPGHRESVVPKELPEDLLLS
jgi:hypothetical protein